jgi:hypothetical protein
MSAISKTNKAKSSSKNQTDSNVENKVEESVEQSVESTDNSTDNKENKTETSNSKKSADKKPKKEETKEEEEDDVEYEEDGKEEDNAEVVVEEDDEEEKKTTKKAKDDEEENEEENEDENTEKKAPPKKAPPKKAKVSAKTSRAKTSNDSENLRRSALKSACKICLVSYFPEISTNAMYDKYAQMLTMHILETIDQISNNEVTEEGDYNPYPSDKYILYSDKVKGKSGSKRSVNSKSTAPKAMIIDQDDDAEVEEVEEEEVEVVIEKKSTKKEVAKKSTKKEEKSEEKKEVSKKNILKFNKNGKTYLGFIVSRVITEVFKKEIPKAIKDRETFTKYVFEGTSRKLKSYLIRSIVASVNRLSTVVNGMQDRGLGNLLESNLGNTYFPGKLSTLLKVTTSYLSDYFKLLGYTIGNHVWISNKTINPQVIEIAMRTLDFGNHEYMVANKLIDENDSDFGLSCGVLQSARKFDMLLNPPKTEEEKQAAKKKREESKKKGDSKKAKASTKKTTSKKTSTKKNTKVEEPEEDAEEEDVEQEDVEEDAEEEDVEQEDAEDEDAAEEEAVDEDVEQEEVEEEPKKQVRKLKK